MSRQQNYPTWFSEQLQTTDDTPTNIVSIEVPDDTILRIRADVIAHETGTGFQDGAGYECIATFQKIGGAAILIGETINAQETDTDYTSWDVYFGVSGANALLIVEGDPYESVNWYCEYRKTQVS